MNRQAKGFDWLAPWYDDLVRLVFGQEVYRSQVAWLDRIPAGARVLIIGGGTGWLLSEVLRRSAAAKVTYLELSGGMLARTQRRMQREEWANHRYELRQGSWQNLSAEETYEVVITCFFLDLFDATEARAAMRSLHQHLSAPGSWLFADFMPVTRPQGWLLRIMYAFFRAFCGISGQRLLPYDRLFGELRLTLREEQYFARKMVRGRWYVQ